MELRTVRYFVAVADAGSVSAATKLVHITQPSLSRQLHQLESELGLQLFASRDGRLQLTAAGLRFLPTARNLVAAADNAKNAAEAIRKGPLDTIHIAAPTVTLTDVLAPFIAGLGPGDPVPTVSALDPNQGCDALEQGADLVLTTVVPPQRFSHQWVATLPILAYVPAAHALAAKEYVCVSELVAHHLLLSPTGTYTRTALDAVVTAQGVEYSSIREFTSSQIAQAVAAAGHGVAVVSDDSRFELVGVPISVPATANETQRSTLAIDLFAAWQPEHHAAAALERLVTTLGGYVVHLYGANMLPVPAAE